MADEEFRWHYLDRSGKEFGPFSSKKMCTWFAQGYFPIGEKLLVRETNWSRHAPVHDLWPDVEPFSRPPREPRGLPPPGPFGAPPPGVPPGYGPPPAWGPPGYGPPPGPGGYGPPPGYPGYPPPHGYGMPPPGYPPGPGYPPMPGYGPPWGPGRGRSRSRSPGRRRGKGDGKGKDGGRREFKPHHTSSVPKQTDLAEKFSSNVENPTTGMLRNIPNKYMQEDLLAEIDEMGFRGTYDFFYLPMDVKNGANVGYAFVNFLRPDDFRGFQDAFEGYQFKRAGSKKRAAVSAAVVQGLRQNVQNLMKKRVAQGQYRPLVMRNGVPTDIETAAKDLDRQESPPARAPKVIDEDEV